MTGSELMVLEGAVKVLEGPIFGVYIEAEFAPVYKGQPLFSEVDIFLRKHGFELFEIIRAKYWKRPINNRFVKSKGQIMYGDMLYLRDFEDFDRILNARSDVYFHKSKVCKAAAISTLYGHMDYAFEILQRGTGNGLFNKKEQAIIKSIIDKNTRCRIDVLCALPDFRGKQRFLRWLGVLGNACKKKEDKWIQGAQWK